MTFKLAYCDYIAHLVQQGLRNDTEHLLDKVGTTKYDLDKNGAFVSPAKSITLWDRQGKAYIVSIQEAPLLDK